VVHKNSLRLRALGLLLVVSGVAMLGLGGLSLIEYGLPMAMGRYSAASQRLSIGSRGEALYNEALDALEEHHWDQATKNGVDAFSAVSDQNGQVPDRQRVLAAEAQFITAAALVEMNKHEQAIAAYDLGLVLMPDQLTPRQAKVVKAVRRTREWLRQSTKTKGKSQPKPDDTNTTPSKTRRTGRM
jgi:hypothetical protein